MRSLASFTIDAKELAELASEEDAVTVQVMTSISAAASSSTGEEYFSEITLLGLLRSVEDFGVSYGRNSNMLASYIQGQECTNANQQVRLRSEHHNTRRLVNYEVVDRGKHHSKGAGYTD